MAYISLLLLCLNLSLLNAQDTISQAKEFVDNYNMQAQIQHEILYHVLWAYQSDMTRDRKDKVTTAQANLAAFTNHETQVAEGLTINGLDPMLKREVKFIRKNSTPKNREMAEIMSSSITSMSQIWGQGGVCFE